MDTPLVQPGKTVYSVDSNREQVQAVDHHLTEGVAYYTFPFAGLFPRKTSHLNRWQGKETQALPLDRNQLPGPTDNWQTPQRAMSSRIISSPREKAVVNLTTASHSSGRPEPEDITNLQVSTASEETAANHEEIISLLNLYKSRNITAKIHYINDDRNRIHAIIQFDENMAYCFKVLCHFALQDKGIGFKELRQNYRIEGQLSFDTDRMCSYVKSQPATNFLQHETQVSYPLPIFFSRQSTKLVKVTPGPDIFRDCLTSHFTRDQWATYVTINEYYNKFVTAHIFGTTYSHDKGVKGRARLFINEQEYLIIKFKCNEKNILINTRSSKGSLNFHNCLVTGKLCFCHKSFVGCITENKPLIHNKSLKRQHISNQEINLFLTPKTVSILKF